MNKSRSIAGLLAIHGVATWSSGPLACATMASWASATQLRISQMATRLRRIVALALLPGVLVIGLLTCAGTAYAQKAPDSVIVAVTPLGVQVTFRACYVSTEGNCVSPFSIYRNPPGFNQSPIGYATLGNNGYSSQGIFNDQKNLTKGQTYTYEVCSGPSANSSRSNCLQATPVTIQPAPATPKPTVTLSGAPATMNYGQSANLSWTSANAYKLDLEPGVGNVTAPAGSTKVSPAGTQTYTLIAYGQGNTGTASAYFTIQVTCPTPWSPPGSVTALGVGLSDVHLKWTNPNTNAGQTCPGPPSEVLMYRQGGTAGWWEQLAALNKSNGMLPTHYTDSGPLLPHTGYEYLVCEGGAPDWQNPNNCSSPPGVFHAGAGYGVITGGADPVLTATRVNANTVRLRIALDQYTVSSVVVTRQGSDDPCRQGGTLGNGLQGCRTTTVGPNGVGVSPAQTVTVYNWNSSGGSQYPPGFQNSQSAPYVINLPDDTTVKPGVEYYYLAQVEWLWSVAQDSATVTVPNAYATLPVQQSLAGGLKSLKSNGNAPPPQSQSNGAAVRRSSAVSRPITPASSSPMVRPAGITAAATPQQSVTAARPMLAPAVTPATPMLQPGHPMMSSTGSSAASLLAQSATAARPAVAPLKAPASRMMPPVRPVEALPNAANLNAAIKQVQQRPHDAQALYALGKAYCASRLTNTGVSYMYMALLLAEQQGNAPLASQIKASLAGQGVKAE